MVKRAGDLVQHHEVRASEEHSRHGEPGLLATGYTCTADPDLGVEPLWHVRYLLVSPLAAIAAGSWSVSPRCSITFSRTVAENSPGSCAV